MARVTVLVCDECNSQEGTKRFEVKGADSKAVVDLCAIHAKPLVDLLTKAPKVAPRRQTSRSTTRRATSMEDIEKLKKK